MKKKMSGDRRFSLICAGILLLLALLLLAPLVLIIAASITEETALVANGYQFIPAKIDFGAYAYLIQQKTMILRAYGISVFVTVTGTALSLVLTALMAYPLSRPDYKYRNLFTFIVFFTMLFSGGIVPSYMVWSRVFHVKNTVAALIFPTYLMTAFNILLVRNYFQNNIPLALVEAAQIDGASELQIFRKVMLPLSTPVMMTVGLFTGLAYWNDWINGLYYINDTRLYSIQNLLNRLIQNINMLKQGNNVAAAVGGAASMPSVGIRMAIAVVAMLPVIIIFPFVQKHLIKGVVIGAVKG